MKSFSPPVSSFKSWFSTLKRTKQTGLTEEKTPRISNYTNQENVIKNHRTLERPVVADKILVRRIVTELRPGRMGNTVEKILIIKKIESVIFIILILTSIDWFSLCYYGLCSEINEF